MRTTRLLLLTACIPLQLVHAVVWLKIRSATDMYVFDFGSCQDSIFFVLATSRACSYMYTGTARGGALIQGQHRVANEQSTEVEALPRICAIHRWVQQGREATACLRPLGAIALPYTSEHCVASCRTSGSSLEYGKGLIYRMR